MLTIIALWVNWAPLYLLFPWRLSVVLVPVATLGIVSNALDVLQRRLAMGSFSGTFHLAGLALATTLFISSSALALNSGEKFSEGESPEYHDLGYEALVRMALKDSDPAAVYLYPPRLFESFRLRTGHPIVADFKSHPFKDVEVLAWWERIEWADRFFAGDACRNASTLYQFNRIVLPQTPLDANQVKLAPTDFLRRCLLSSGRWRSSVNLPGYEILVKVIQG